LGDGGFERGLQVGGELSVSMGVTLGCPLWVGVLRRVSLEAIGVSLVKRGSRNNWLGGKENKHGGDVEGLSGIYGLGGKGCTCLYQDRL